MWKGVITSKMGDSPPGGVTVVRKVCQLMEKCDDHGRRCLSCESCQDM